MKLCSSLLIPLGSAFIAATLLDTIVSFYWLLNDVGSIVYFRMDHGVAFDWNLIFTLACVSIRAFLSLCLWLFVIIGHRSILLLWIPVSVGVDLTFIYHAIFNINRTHLTDEIWFLNLAGFLLFRFYVTIIAIQCVQRLVQTETNWRNSVVFTQSQCQDGNENVPFDIKELEKAANELDIACNKHLKLDPIGKGPIEILEFYYQHTTWGPFVLLQVEMIWNIFSLVTHSLTEFIFGGNVFFMIYEEEFVMRIWRITICAIAYGFVVKNKKTLMRFWLIIYFWTMIVSIGLFVYVATNWNDISYIIMSMMTYFFLSDNIFRVTVIYLCLRFTLAPHLPPSTRSNRNRRANPNRIRINSTEDSPLSMVMTNENDCN